MLSQLLPQCDFSERHERVIALTPTAVSPLPLAGEGSRVRALVVLKLRACTSTKFEKHTLATAAEAPA